MLGAGELGLGLAARGAVGRGAWIEADFVADRYRLAGRSHADAAAFRAAVGGTVAASGHLVIGPYVASDAPELLADGDFAAGTTADWTNSGSSLAIEAGTLRVTGGGGNGSGAYRTIAPLIEDGRAYCLTAKAWRGTAASVTVGFGAGAGGTDAHGQTANLTATSAQSLALYCGAFRALTASIAVRNFSNPSSGTYFVDRLSLREALPFAGFRPGAISAVIEGTTPASGGSGGVLFQADDNAEFNGNWLERNYVRLVWDGSGHLRLVVSHGGGGTAVEQVNLDLGQVAAGAAFRVGFSARAGAYRAMLLGEEVKSASAGKLPGLAALRLGRGRSAATGLWTGEIGRVAIYREALGPDELVARVAQAGVVAWGDSLTAGAGATGGSGGSMTYPRQAQTLFDAPFGVVQQGMGGQTSTQIAARMGGVPTLVSLKDHAIPASGAVEVTAKSVNMLVKSGVYEGSQRGWLAGVAGTMTTDAAGVWTFTWDRAGAAVPLTEAARFVPAAGHFLRGLTAWLWMGRNGANSGHSVVGDIAAAVGGLGHERYLVGGIVPSSNDTAPVKTQLAGINSTLATTYGARFIDLLAALQGEADGSDEDAADVADGLVPRSLRSDHLHLNDDGYGVVATAFHAAHVAMGW